MSLPSWAVKGRKVVCVDASNRGYGRPVLVKGAIYTIEWVGQRATDYAPGIIVEEITNAFAFDGTRRSYIIDRFRPLVEDSDEDGIEARIFNSKHLRTKQPERERA